MTSFDLGEFLPYQLAAAAERVSRDFAERYRREFGISVPEWRVLAHLNQADEVSVRDIEGRVAMEKSKVSRAASRLEAAGYVEKRVNELDRRLVSLSLTAKGRDLMTRLIPMALSFQTEMQARIGPDAVRLEVMLKRIMAEIK